MLNVLADLNFVSEKTEYFFFCMVVYIIIQALNHIFFLLFNFSILHLKEKCYTTVIIAQICSSIAWQSMIGYYFPMITKVFQLFLIGWVLFLESSQIQSFARRRF